MDERQKLRIINEVAVATAQSIELDIVLKTALRKVMEAFNVNNGLIYLLDFHTDRLVLKAHSGLNAAFVAEMSNIPPGTGCAGWAIDHNEVYSAYGRPESGFICEDAQRLLALDCLVAGPISTKRRVHGVIELFAPTSRRLTEDEAGLITIIGDQIGIAIENARLYEESRNNVVKLTELQQELAKTNKRLQAHLTKEARIAEILQKSLLPRRLPSIPGLDIAARLISATEAAAVGGDFYDFIELDAARIAVVVGDVSGSGIEVATLTSMARNTIRAFAFEDPDAARVTTRTNRVAYAQTDPSKFIALFIAFIDTEKGMLEFCLAGQPSPIVLGVDGKIAQLAPGSTAVGADKESLYKKEGMDLEKIDTLLIFTDGLIEARKGHDFFGEEAVKDFLIKNRDLSAEDLVDSLLAAARDFADGNLSDDVAIVSIRLKHPLPNHISNNE